MKGTVLLTGATGFLGSNILRLLVDGGYSVISLKRSTSDTRRVATFLDNPLVSFFDVDTGELKVCFESKIDVIIHTATCYGRSGESEDHIRKTNVDFPRHLLALGIENDVHAFLNTDTFSNDKIAMQGKENVYVKTKKEFLAQAKEMIVGNQIKFANLVVEQMYGPDDNETKFTPFVIRELLSGKDKVDFTPGEQKRDFIFVEDCAQAYLHVIKHMSSLEQFEQFGIGTGTGTMLKDFVTKVKEKIGGDTVLNFGGLPYRDNEIMDQAADTSHNQKIAWTANVSLDEGLDKTIAFYKAQV